MAARRTHVRGESAPQQEVFLTKSIKTAEADIRTKRRADQAKDGLKAAAEYEAAATAMREKTAKLKALRLAKEAEDAANAPPAPEVKVRKKAKKKVAAGK